MPRRIKSKPAAPEGKRIGTKRSDLRFQSPDGQVWASPFEWRVYDAVKRSGRDIRRATSADTVDYNTSVKHGRCTQCSSDSVVQERTYTPDLYIGSQGSGRAGYFVETKGHFPGPKRNLFRQVKAQTPDIDLRIIASSDHWVSKGKTRLSDWAKRFKIMLIIWKGELPEGW